MDQPIVAGPLSKDETGKTYGRWRVIEMSAERSPRGLTLWVCECACGVRKPISGARLRGGGSQSCGCLQKELVAERIRLQTTTHGHTKGQSSGSGFTPEYSAWLGMKRRCGNENLPEYKNYGARNILVCEEWMDSFEAFFAHIGPRPSSKHSIDRVDNERGYEPGNVRWTTQAVQMRNTRRNHWIEFRGERKVLTDWAIALGFSPAVLSQRINRYGWSVERAFTTPVK